jgi:uncharacterized membrane protein
MHQNKNRRSAQAARRRADLRLIRFATTLSVVLTVSTILAPSWTFHTITSVAVVGLLAICLKGIAWLLKDGV